MPSFRAHRRSCTSSPSRLGLAGLCLLITACATPGTESGKGSGSTKAPTPAETSATQTQKEVSKLEFPIDQSKMATSWGASVIHPADAETGLLQHHEVLQQVTDEPLSSAEVGYYLDNLHGRLKQKLANPGIDLDREGDVVTIRVAGVQAFDPNSVVLKPGMKSNLVPLAEIMAEYDRTQIQIMGHTDDSGADDYNQKLSEQRASALAVTLVESGVAPRRIAIIGFGETQPLQPNTNKANRSQNRRLELRLLPVIANDS